MFTEEAGWDFCHGSGMVGNYAWGLQGVFLVFWGWLRGRGAERVNARGAGGAEIAKGGSTRSGGAAGGRPRRTAVL
jgi:hypothetical protein